MARYLLDANILLRIANKSSSQHQASLQAMTTLTQQGHDLVVTPQVLVEFWAVATRPLDANGFGWTSAEVIDEINRFLGRFALIVETPNVFVEWLRLVSTNHVIGKKSHDARLAALCKVGPFPYL
jgi:predicted nucleic acid-binding protein